jgi:hypothetical protein
MMAALMHFNVLPYDQLVNTANFKIVIGGVLVRCLL